MLLKIVAPLAGPVLGLAGEKLDEHRKSDIEKFAKVVDSAQSMIAKVSDPSAELITSGRAVGGAPSLFGLLEADVRVLESLMLKLDPERVWGGLSKIVTPEGLVLYLCRDHALEYVGRHSSL